MLDVAKSSQTTAGAVSTLADAAKEEGRRSRLLVKLTVLIAVLALATLIATVWH
jgi:flagellar basal body-associated protein FliL